MENRQNVVTCLLLDLSCFFIFYFIFLFIYVLKLLSIEMKYGSQLIKEFLVSIFRSTDFVISVMLLKTLGRSLDPISI
jgi:hypothetical protein